MGHALRMKFGNDPATAGHVLYIRDIVLTDGVTGLMSEDFSGDLSAWTQIGDVSIAASPGGGGSANVLKADGSAGTAMIQRTMPESDTYELTFDVWFVTTPGSPQTDVWASSDVLYVNPATGGGYGWQNSIDAFNDSAPPAVAGEWETVSLSFARDAGTGEWAMSGTVGGVAIQSGTALFDEIDSGGGGGDGPPAGSGLGIFLDGIHFEAGVGPSGSE